MRLLGAVIACLVLVRVVTAGETLVPLTAAHGTVEKAGKDNVKVKPRGPDGKFEKALTLKITGTSRITILAPQNRAGKIVLAQRDAEAKELQPNQPITFIYANPGSGPVLLTAVVQPPQAK